MGLGGLHPRPGQDRTRLSPSDLVASIQGIPFVWFPSPPLAGVISILIGWLQVVPSERKRVMSLRTFGAISHFLLNAPLINRPGSRTRCSGRYPAIVGYSALYLSTQPEPAIPARGVHPFDRNLDETLLSEGSIRKSVNLQPGRVRLTVVGPSRTALGNLGRDYLEPPSVAP